ncbi:MAG: hypothetical protein ACRELB_01675, partial [Polyangiaceae bacterium]
SGGFVGSAVLDGQGQVYVTANESVEVLRFDQSVAAPSPWGGPARQDEIELAAAGGALYWAASEGPTAALWKVPAATFATASPAKSSFGGGGDVIGLVADASAVYAAIAPTPPGPSPDSWQWPASTAGNAPASGQIFRVVPGATGSVDELTPAGGISFYPAMMEHVLAQSSLDLYWVDSAQVGPDAGRVMAVSKAGWTSATPRRVGGASLVAGTSVGFVGLAATETTVAWAVAPEPTPGSTGCWVWAVTGSANPRQVFVGEPASTAFLCSGLAIDDAYAYFAIVQVYVPPAGPDSALLRGTAIGRVPLAGGALQTVPMSSDRWYGARRVLVDDAYVYAVDPSYVLRFPKTAFGP